MPPFLPGFPEVSYELKVSFNTTRSLTSSLRFFWQQYCSDLQEIQGVKNDMIAKVLVGFVVFVYRIFPLKGDIKANKDALHF